MSDTIWVSVRDTKGRTFTVGGTSYPEFAANLTDILGTDGANKVIEDFQFLADPQVQAAVAAADPIRPSGSGGFGGGRQAPAQAAPGAPVCDHGPMEYNPPGTSTKTGKRYSSSWRCVSRDRNNQCKAKWNDD